MVVLPLAYLGSVQYFSKLCFGEHTLIDVHEHYIKQSCRNRCRILTADGVTDLVATVAGTPNDRKCAVRDTRLDYSKRWQHRHWISLVSAYKGSPYFDFYADRLESFYAKRYDFLFDFNSELSASVLEMLGSKAELHFSQEYIQPGTPGITDMRHSLSEKPRLWRPDPAFRAAPYYQVFSERLPFAPNLSIVDLLFCEGPHALAHLQRCVMQ